MSNRGFSIALVRVPRSAGASLTLFAEEALPRARVFRLPSTLAPERALSAAQQLRHAAGAARSNYRNFGVLRTETAFDVVNGEARPGDILAGGFLDFDALAQRLSRPFKIVFLMRDPVARALSEYGAARHAFQTRGWLPRFNAPLLTKAAGRYDLDGYLDFLLDHMHAYGNIACKSLGLRQRGVIGRHFAEHAFHFGCLENLEAFVDGFQRKTARAAPFPHVNMGRSRSKPTITPGQRRKLERLYEEDLYLHEWIVEQTSAFYRPKGAFRFKRAS